MNPTDPVDVFLDKQARRSISTKTLQWIQESQPVKQWFDGDRRGRVTRYLYANAMRKFFPKLGRSPEQLLKELNDAGGHRQAKLDIKATVANWRDRPATANLIISGLRALARFHEVEPELTLERYTARRKWKKERVEWEDAIRVIEECPEPYRQAFMFMLWGGLDQNTFAKINSNAPELRTLNGGDVHATIQRQIKIGKAYVRIDLPPRKNSLDTYFVLVPALYVPKFPLLSIRYQGSQVRRGGTFLPSKSLVAVWRRAARRAKVYRPGLGPHTLRSVFRTRCGELGVGEIGEWMLGHGGDVYGYSREGLNETFLIEGPQNRDGSRKGGLNILWGSAPIISRRAVDAELKERDRTIAGLQEELDRLRAERTDASAAEQRHIKELEERMSRLEAVHTERVRLKRE